MTSEARTDFARVQATPARSKFKPLRFIEGIVVVGCCIEVYSIPVLDSFENNNIYFYYLIYHVSWPWFQSSVVEEVVRRQQSKGDVCCPSNRLV
jgi:hypothetical protein